MNELIEQIQRFQKLRDYVGASKISSFSVELYFDPDGEGVGVVLGGYDIPSWNRHESIRTTVKDLLKDLKLKIDEAYKDCEDDLLA